MCNGTGSVFQQQMFLRIRSTCPKCNGSGKVITTPCKTCSGKGRVRSETEVPVNIPGGVDAGNRLRVSGKGNEGEPGAPAGDLYVDISVKEHEFFRRHDNDIICEIPISYPQACLGTKLKVRTIDGETVLEVPAGTPSGKIFTLRGKGVPHLQRGYGNGDQHVQVFVGVPKKMGADEEVLVRKLAELQGEKVSDSSFFSRIFK
jgi:molecular chaperone DnaJ